ncbi:MAG: tripartite tricarboxylate transporter permease [Candidatus Thermoplasmatota archaeon]|nr:tripartite tricarboxylate transporter permease [Candidatus Thermoplasmatota archaeon]
MLELFIVISFAFIGAIIGCITGLIPGLHVNNIALILLSLSGTIAFSLSTVSIIESEIVPILVCVIIIATSISHTFVNIIPSTFLGVPEEDTALVLLPAHSMLLEGKGYGAISLSAMGSFGAIIMSFILLIPFRFLIGPPVNFYGLLGEIIPWILLAISIALIGTEKSTRHVAYAILIFLLSGIFGMLAMDADVSSPIGIHASLLFPALAGLFGVSTLFHSFNTNVLPEQKLDDEKFDFIEGSKDVGTGVIAGSIVSILPGVTSAVATIMAMVARGKKDRKNVIVTLSAVNTATSFFVISVLFMIGKARSGSAIVINEIMEIDRWSSAAPPYSLCYLLIAVVVTACLSYYATKSLGKIIAKHISSIPYNTVAKISVITIFIMVFLFTGFTGIVALIAGTLIGLLCLELGVRRSTCMGVLLLPIMLTYFL